MAICDSCNKEMLDKVSCDLAVYDDFPDKIPRSRIVSEHDCHDCSAPEGTLHHPGCDAERCPLCHGQAISCGCTEELTNE